MYQHEGGGEQYEKGQIQCSSSLTIKKLVATTHSPEWRINSVSETLLPRSLSGVCQTASEFRQILPEDRLAGGGVVAADRRESEFEVVLI